MVATAPSRADPGATPDPAGPDQQLLQAQLDAAIRTGTATGTFIGPAGNERWVGVFGTHAASAGYGYPYPAAPDCNEASLGADCVGDSRGFIQGQCTSWVAFRLAARNGLSFSNWYADRHWGNASEWSKVAKGIGHKPDKTPAVGAIGWYKRGHVSYVEDVYSSGTILVSEMNTDGHNGFHFSTVSPGDHGYPDKFIHLDDVIPVDTAAPSVPAGLRVVSHRGRTGVAWRPSTDAFGVAGYRVMRNGVPLATTGRTSYWDTTALAGQATVYAVVAYDSAGHSSRPARVRVKPGTEAVDRAWVETASGPALCGRTGTAKRQRLGCRLLANGAWHYVGLRPHHGLGRPEEPGIPPEPRWGRVLLPRRRSHRPNPRLHHPRHRRPPLGFDLGLPAHAPARGRRRDVGGDFCRARALRALPIRTPTAGDLLDLRRQGLAQRKHDRAHPGGSRGWPGLPGRPGRRGQLLSLAPGGPRRPVGVHHLRPDQPGLGS